MRWRRSTRLVTTNLTNPKSPYYFQILFETKLHYQCYRAELIVFQVPLELLGHAQQILHRAMYTYGEDAPCYSAPRMLEEALKTDLRCEDFKDWSYSIESVDGSSIIRHHGIKLDQEK